MSDQKHTKAANAERDIHSYVFDLCTDQGNRDLVGNNSPIFSLPEPQRFSDFNHAVKLDPQKARFQNTVHGSRLINERHIATCTRDDPAYELEITQPLDLLGK